MGEKRRISADISSRRMLVSAPWPATLEWASGERHRLLRSHVECAGRGPAEFLREYCWRDEENKDEDAFQDADMLYIHPDECIDCGACVPACPVEAIFSLDETPRKWAAFIRKNADYYGPN